MGSHREKRDRTARLLSLEVLLAQSPGGLEIAEIARKCSISIRTAYRDLKALESELRVPIWSEGSKRGVVEGHHLPPIHFTVPEAMNIALAARLMQSNSRWYDPHRVSALIKLAAVVPPPLRKQIQDIIDWMEKQPRDQKQIRVSDRLAEAWILQCRASLVYRESDDQPAREMLLEPYLIIPATPGNAGFVVGAILPEKLISTLKIGDIVEVRVSDQSYAIPADFDALAHLNLGG